MYGIDVRSYHTYDEVFVFLEVVNRILIIFYVGLDRVDLVRKGVFRFLYLYRLVRYQDDVIISKMDLYNETYCCLLL
ncbi:hypothetical protein D3C79_959010 [compost metagenome]